VVDGMIKLMAAEGDIGPLNLGSDLDIPILEIVQRILEMTGSSSRIVFQPALLFMTPLGLPDLTKAKEKLGWMPLVRLDGGLKNIIDYTMAHKNLMAAAFSPAVQGPSATAKTQPPAAPLI